MQWQAGGSAAGRICNRVAEFTDTVTVPGVMSLTLDKAPDHLEDLGLEVEAEDTVDGKSIIVKKNWQVTSQDSAEDAQMAKGSTVHLGVKNLDKIAAAKAAADKVAADKAAAEKAAADKAAAKKAGLGHDPDQPVELMSLFSRGIGGGLVVTDPSISSLRLDELRGQSTSIFRIRIGGRHLEPGSGRRVRADVHPELILSARALLPPHTSGVSL
jgi:hypothetical protein